MNLQGLVRNLLSIDACLNPGWMQPTGGCFKNTYDQIILFLRHRENHLTFGRRTHLPELAGFTPRLPVDAIVLRGI